MIKEEFNAKLSECEEILQRISSNIANGVLSEKLMPSELLKRTETDVDRLINLALTSEELMLVLKPERTNTINAMSKNLRQTLTNFKDILVQNTSDPLANSRLAFEQLRRATADGSDFLFLMREIRENPSPIISRILDLKKISETKSAVISIQAKEDVEPLVKYVLGRIDDFRTALIGLERKVDEIKQVMRELQEESLKILSEKTSQKPTTVEDEKEKKQLSLSNFKTEDD